MSHSWVYEESVTLYFGLFEKIPSSRINLVHDVGAKTNTNDKESYQSINNEFRSENPKKIFEISHQETQREVLNNSRVKNIWLHNL